MKKKIVISFFLVFLIIIVGLLLIKIAFDSFNKKFDYDKAKQITIKYLNKNEEQLKKISRRII